MDIRLKRVDEPAASSDSAELAAHDTKLRELRRQARVGMPTLVYGARDAEHNDAVLLAENLRRRTLS